MKNTFLISIAIFGISISVFGQNRFYVSTSANGQNTGTSWADAFTNLHDALASAQAGDFVWVAKGVYHTDTAINRDRAFVLKSGVKLYGSFNGTEGALAQRNIPANPTVLSGNIGDPADSTDNAYTVLYMAYPDTSTLVDGFTLRHGYAKSDTNYVSTSPIRSGGAVYVLAFNGKGRPSFANCIFSDNYAQDFGGAYYVFGQGSSGSTPLFRNCLFYNNKAGVSGGAIYLSGGNGFDRGIEMDHCEFNLNHAGAYGGSIYWANAFGPETMDFQGCIFTQSTSSAFGSGIFLWRTGTNDLRLHFDSCHIFGNKKFPSNFGSDFLETEGFPDDKHVVFYLENSRIENNEDISTLFRIPHYQGYNDTNPFDSTFILNNVFSGNKTGHIIRDETIKSYVKIENNLFSNNDQYDSTFPKDDIWIWGSNIHISKNIFYNNRAPSTIYVGMFARPNSKTVVENNVFWGNDRPLALTVKPVGSIKHDTAYITNNIFVNNKTDNPFYLFSHPINNVLSNNIFYGNKNPLTGLPILPFPTAKDTFYFANNLFDTLSYCTDYPNVTCGPNNLYGLNPMFRDPTNHDYTLAPCSPLINAGNNQAASNIPTDLAGNPRIQGGMVDIGAYESPAFALAAEPEVKPACIGTANGSISISPVFGCEPYTYNWSPAVGIGPELNNLPPGDYLLTITDGSGRQILDTLQVAAAPLPELAPLITDVQCVTGLGGSISSGVTNGTSPYNYQWQPSAADTAKLTHLSPGAYGLTVVDANGCQDSASANISLQGMITLMVDGQAIRCNGETGWLSALPATGAAPFSWLWQGWPGTDSIAQPLSPGIYAVTVSDAYGCTAAFAFPPMTEPDSLWATVGTNPQIDLLMPDGAAVVTTISGGMAPFDFDWNTGSTMQAITGLTAGMYTVTVTDKNGCEAVVEVVVDLMVSATDEAEGGALMLYPNPAVDWVKVVVPARLSGLGGQAGMRECLVELSDASGRVLRSAALVEASDYTLDLSGMPVGGYLVTVRNGIGAAVFVGKVVKR